jgi:hypothetical protein
MTAARPASHLRLVASAPSPADSAFAPVRSFGEFPQLRPLDPHALRRVFPDRWSAFLRATLRDTTEVAYVYGVTDRAARDWWDGVSGPRGSSVVVAAVQYPQAFRQYLVPEASAERFGDAA